MLCTREAQYHLGARALLRTHLNICIVRLHDLVHDRQPQPRSPLELRLERLEYLLQMTMRNSDARVFERHSPSVTVFGNAHNQRSAARHRADTVVSDVPEHLFEFVDIAVSPSVLDLEVQLNID